MGIVVNAGEVTRYDHASHDVIAVLSYHDQSQGHLVIRSSQKT